MRLWVRQSAQWGVPAKLHAVVPAVYTFLVPMTHFKILGVLKLPSLPILEL